MGYEAGPAENEKLSTNKKENKQVERKKMDEKKEITGQFRFDQDSKRFHRFKIETELAEG